MAKKSAAKEGKKTRYFIYSTTNCYDFEQKIKRGEIGKVFQAVAYDGKVTKHLMWFLLEQDISFETKSMGAGITIFYIDATMPYFVQPKEEVDEGKS